MSKQITAAPFAVLALICFGCAVWQTGTDTSKTALAQIYFLMASIKYAVCGMFWLLFGIVAMMADERGE